MLLSVAKDDGWSIRTLRIFSDEWEKMDRSLVDRERSVLLVFQFYVTGRTAHVRCPSFDEAAPPDEAKRLYEQVVASVTTPRDHCGNRGLCLRHAVELQNHGPVTYSRTVTSKIGKHSVWSPKCWSACQLRSSVPLLKSLR